MNAPSTPARRERRSTPRLLSPLLLGCALSACAAHTVAGEVESSRGDTPPATSPEPVAAVPAGPARAEDDGDRMQWWRDARFGLFLHWGLYSILEGEWKGGTDYAEWIRNSAHIPIGEYDQLVKRFDPVDFDADEWARMAKAAGMRYVVITTKHHDGFCLFDSKQTDFDIASTPWGQSTPQGRDVMREIADACRRQGLRIGWYHSIMDWHHPDYLPRRSWEKDRPTEGADFQRYVAYLQAEVKELLTNYGPIDVMWFDGEWEATWTHEDGVKLYQECRELQPNVIVNNRVDKGRSGMAGMTTAGFVGDFGTPEQEVPATGFPGVDWESCITMNRHWGWNKADKDWKSVPELIRTLVDVVSKGGNLLLNIGPTPQGTFPPLAIERLTGIGRWMDVNGESIHGTQASPFGRLPWGRCTRKGTGKDTRLYLHVFDWPSDGALLVPGLGNDTVGARLLAAPDTVLTMQRTEEGVVVTVPTEAPNTIDSVVELRLDGDPIVYRVPTIEADSDILVDALAVRVVSGSSGLALHYTLDGSDPTVDSPLVSGPIELHDSATVRVRAFHEGRPVTAIVERHFERVEPTPGIAFVRAPDPGLEARTFAGDWDTLPDFDALQPTGSEVVDSIAVPDAARAEHVGLVLEGLVSVRTTGLHRFALTSDDGARLWIDGTLCVDNDGLHSAQTRTGVAALGNGWHRLRIEWFNKTGSIALSVEQGLLGAPLAPIPATALAHP